MNVFKRESKGETPAKLRLQAAADESQSHLGPNLRR